MVYPYTDRQKRFLAIAQSLAAKFAQRAAGHDIRGPHDDPGPLHPQGRRRGHVPRRRPAELDPAAKVGEARTAVSRRLPRSPRTASGSEQEHPGRQKRYTALARVAVLLASNARSAAGSVTWRVLPSPGSLSAQILPPWHKTLDFAM